MKPLLIERFAQNQKLIKSFQKKGLISEELTRADIEVIKRLIMSGFESIWFNMFVRRGLITTGINWRE